MIPLPMMAYAVVGIVVAVFGFYKYGYHIGWTDRDVDMQLAIAAKNEQARVSEKKMADAIASKDEQLRKANDEIDKKRDAMRKLASVGQLRLPAPSCTQTSANASVAVQPATDVSELERQTIEALIDIAADGDKAITKLNACIDTYNKVMEQINADQ